MAVFRVAQMSSVAPHILNVIVAAFSSVATNVYQFVCTEQKAPDNPEADRSQQNCGSIFILVINQLDAQNLFYNRFISCL